MARQLFVENPPDPVENAGNVGTTAPAADRGRDGF